MPTNPPKEPPWRLSFMCILAVSTIVMTTATLFDQTVTAYLKAHQIEQFTEMMGRSLFEGELPGANDPLVLLLLISLTIYWLSWRTRGSGNAQNPWIPYRPQAGFILLCALVIAFLMMHGFKLSMGRARPGLVFNHGWPFSPWYAFGPHFIGNGPYSGAFPSGHTAQVFSAMAFAYVLIGDPLFKNKARIIGWAWGAGILILSVTMAVARCMSASHWLTDVAGSICLGWPVMHLIYHWLLFVPDQRRHMESHGTLPPVPTAWELRLGGFMVLITAGILLFVNGLRAVLLQQALWLAIGMLPGLALIYWSVRKTVAVRRRVWEAILEP